MSTHPESPARTGDTWQWWESRRLRYNIGLAIAGALAWALLALEASLLTDWFSISKNGSRFWKSNVEQLGL